MVPGLKLVTEGVDVVSLKLGTTAKGGDFLIFSSSISYVRLFFMLTLYKFLSILKSTVLLLSTTVTAFELLLHADNHDVKLEELYSFTINNYTQIIGTR